MKVLYSNGDIVDLTVKDQVTGIVSPMTTSSTNTACFRIFQETSGFWLHRHFFVVESFLFFKTAETNPFCFFSQISYPFCYLGSLLSFGMVRTLPEPYILLQTFVFFTRDLFCRYIFPRTGHSHKTRTWISCPSICWRHFLAFPPDSTSFTMSSCTTPKTTFTRETSPRRNPIRETTPCTFWCTGPGFWSLYGLSFRCTRSGRAPSASRPPCCCAVPWISYCLSTFSYASRFPRSGCFWCHWL